jgi:O-antigen/teichoic acid export membrane protein
VNGLSNPDAVATSQPVVNKWRNAVVRGIAWNTLYQFFQIAVSFGAMLLLVRVIPPTEYGKATAVVGVLTILNTLNSSLFMSQALQLTDGIEPDWSLHWSVGICIQCALSILCHAVAGLCWLIAVYRPLAPLLHIAAVGLMLDAPNQLRLMMLRRAMDFRRLRILSSVGTLVSIATILALGLKGGGAYGIVLGSNVFIGLPFGFDLLFVQRWRPKPGWLRPDWSAYRPAVKFGLQQAATMFLRGSRAAMEAVVLPPAVGFIAIGLWSRAQALYSTSVGRVTTVLLETVYPALPRCVADLKRYSVNATLLLQATLWVALPGGLFLGIEGHRLSRLLYGAKWIGADPMILPGSIAGVALVILSVSSGILLADNRLRTCLLLEIVSASLAIPTLTVVWAKGSMVTYAWAVAIAQIAATSIAISKASCLLVADWFRVAFLPAILGTVLAGAAILAADTSTGSWPLATQIITDTAIYASIVLLVHRLVFPRVLAGFIERMPGAMHLKAVLRLSAVLPESA